MNALVQTAGVHGYSSPCPNHIVFSTRDYLSVDMLANRALHDLICGHLLFGKGMYNGQHEHSYALPEALYHEFVRRFPVYMAGQESILILGSPQARNWRPATLRFIDGSGRADVDLGMWRSVTAEEATKHDNWSFFNGHFFICEIDPPANMYEAEQRKIAKRLAILDKIATLVKELDDV